MITTKTQSTISPTDALDVIRGGAAALIDVRSEEEFAQGAIPGFASAPLLRDPERHLVGLTYKQKGQAEAIALGEQLVAPFAAERVAQWIALASARPDAAIVTCWRGGLRSQLVCERLSEAGIATRRVDGGYKEMRRELMRTLDEPPPLLTIGGLTGSGKTRLLTSLPFDEKVDLEHHAGHRGSTFGGLPLRAQPSQATFENAIAMDLRKAPRPVVTEDESAAIGRVRIPLKLFNAILASPVVWVEVPLAERVRGIFSEYVEEPLAQGIPSTTLATTMESGIRKLARRLGSESAMAIEKGIVEPLMAGNATFEKLAPWIEIVLTEYYDKSYHHAFLRQQRQVLFRGTFEACRQWILHRYV